MDDGYHEVADETYGDQAGDDGFHGSNGLERVTKAGVKRADSEECECRGDEEEINHGSDGY